MVVGLSLTLLGSPALGVGDGFDAAARCGHCGKELLPKPLRLRAGPKYARDRRVDIAHLRLDVTPDFTQRQVEGWAELTFTPIALPLAQLELDAVDLRIPQVTLVGGQLARHEVTPEQLVLHFDPPLPPDHEVTLKMQFHAEPRHGLYFRTPEMGYPEGDTQLWTQGEAELHRFWFPCYDYPNERFTSEIICHAPEGMEVMSNGQLVGPPEAEADGLVHWHWRQDQPHVNYLIALAVGYFHKLESQVGQVPLTLLVPPSEAAQAEGAFRDTAKIIAFYEKEIGVPFPWAKYAQTYCHDFLAGGMENTSSTFQAAGLLFSPATETLRSLHGLDAHELAHQWFGDLLTCRDWSHLWLNEGFATYYAALYETERDGSDAGRYTLWQAADQVFQAADRRPPVWRDYEDPMQQFDSRAYPKGAWVLHMLRSRLGTDLYRLGIRTYLERHRQGIVRTEDLQDVLEEVSGLSLDQFFDQWLYHGGFPELKASYRWEEATKQARLTMKQTQKVDAQVPLFALEMPVVFWDAEGKELGRFTMALSQAEDTAYFPLPAAPALVRLDPDFTLLAQISMDLPDAMLDRQLEADITGRLLALHVLKDKRTASAAERAGKRLKEDAFHGVRSAAAQTLAAQATPEAMAQLQATPRQPDARVRLAWVKALATFPQAEAQDALEAAANREKNPQILAAILQTWGTRPGVPALSRKLRQWLSLDSYHQEITLAVIATLRAQNDARLLPSIRQRLDDIASQCRARSLGSALEDVGFLARDAALSEKETTRLWLVGFLAHPRLELQAAAARALALLGDARSLAPLELLADRPSRGLEDPVQQAAQKAVQDLRSLRAGAPELKAFTDQIQKLREQTETLREEVEDLKKRTQPDSKQKEEKTER